MSRIDLEPKIGTNANGETVYACLWGHAHEFRSVATFCNMEYDALHLDAPPLPQASS